MLRPMNSDFQNQEGVSTNKKNCREEKGTMNGTDNRPSSP